MGVQSCNRLIILNVYEHEWSWKDLLECFGHLLCKRPFPTVLKFSFSPKWRTSAPSSISFSCRRLAWGPKATVITFTFLSFTSSSCFITWSFSSHKQVLWSVKIIRTCIKMRWHVSYWKHFYEKHYIQCYDTIETEIAELVFYSLVYSIYG